MSPGVLIALGGGVARSAENLAGGLRACLAAHCGDASGLGEALASCRAAGLITDENDRIRLTGLGQAAALHGLTPAMVATLRPWTTNPCGATALGLRNRFQSFWPCPGRAGGVWPPRPRVNRAVLGARVGRVVRVARPGRPGPLETVMEEPRPEQLAAIEAAGRLWAWIGPEPTPQSKREPVGRRGCWPAPAKGWRGWRGSAAARTRRVPKLARVGLAACGGAPHEAAALADLRVEGLGRGGLHK